MNSSSTHSRLLGHYGSYELWAVGGGYAIRVRNELDLEFASLPAAVDFACGAYARVCRCNAG